MGIARKSFALNRPTLKKHRALWLVAALTAAALVPLYGDPRKSPVTHSEWARMMLRGLEFEENIASVANAEDIFDTLAWKDQRNLVGSAYKRGVEVTKRGDFVDTAQEPGEVAYDVPVLQKGDYNVRLRLRGAVDQPFKVEIRRDGAVDAVEIHHPTGSGADQYASVDLGWIPLQTGNHTISVFLPPATSLESIQISPPCVSPIEPENGWRGAALTTADDLALTLLQALDMEYELPPADQPIELRAGDFEVIGPASVAQGRAGTDDFELRATPAGLHAIVHADITVPGLYAVSVWTAGGDGQTWLADACRRSDLCPIPDTAPRWRNILTSRFNVGRHSFSVMLTNGATVGQLRLQRLKNTSEDYVAAVKRLGFDVGPAGPITRAKAREAMDWLRERWKAKEAGDRACFIQPPFARVAGVDSGAGAGQALALVIPPGGGPPGGGPPGPPGPPIPPGGGPPPLVPPPPPTDQPPATPVLPVR